MTEALDDVWTSRDYPVLREVTRRIDAGEHYPPDASVAETLGFDVEMVRLAGYALRRRGLVRLDEADDITFADVAGAAYLITGLHPDTDDALDALVGLLRQAAEQTGDEDEQGRLKRAASSLLDVSRGVMSGVLTAYLAGQLPH